MERVFISYSRKDKVFVQHLASDLERSGLDVWWDLTDIQGSDVWMQKIEEGLDSSKYYILVMTPDALKSRWVRRELLSADQKEIKIIPVHLRACKSFPLAVRDLQPVDAINRSYDVVFQEVLRIIQGRTSKGGLASSNLNVVNRALQEISQKDNLRDANQVWARIEFVKIPRGKFLMGSKSTSPHSVNYEHTQHVVEIPYDYWIGRFPVKASKFVEYLQSRKLNHPIMEHHQEKTLYPAGYISWYDAQGFCQWLNDLRGSSLPKGIVFRLPSEAEWEKAARGPDGRVWPWGNVFDKMNCNSAEGGIGQITPIDYFSPQGDSPYGAADMVGNVWEWVNSLSWNYPYSSNDGRENLESKDRRILRGGAYNFTIKHVRAAARGDSFPDKFYSNYGFRVAVGPQIG